jgi:hypothetical protein
MVFGDRGCTLLFTALLAMGSGSTRGGELTAATSFSRTWLGESDRDGDGVPDDGDDCPLVADPAQRDADRDGDGVPDDGDDCPLVADPAQRDADRDGHGDACDCAPGDPRAWERPGEVLGFRVSRDRATIAWDIPASPGGLADGLRYDLLRSPDPGDFVTSASCVATGIGPYPLTADLSRPPAGRVNCYLVRARNSCSPTPGPLAFDPDGYEITSRRCP